MVGTTIFFPFNIPSIPSSAIRWADFFKNFGTAQIIVDDIGIEFVGARKESYRKDSRNPVVENGSLQDDQDRRDFTINAMAICLNKDRWGELLDPFDGISDLDKKRITTPLAPDKTFDDDPLRMMRAVRFAAQLDFRIDAATLSSMRTHASRISIVAPERVAVEFNKIMQVAKPSYGLGLLYTSGLLQEVLPELIALKGIEEVFALPLNFKICKISDFESSISKFKFSLSGFLQEFEIVFNLETIEEISVDSSESPRKSNTFCD